MKASCLVRPSKNIITAVHRPAVTTGAGAWEAWDLVRGMRMASTVTDTVPTTTDESSSGTYILLPTIPG